MHSGINLRAQAMPGDGLPFTPPDEVESLGSQSNVPIAMLHTLGERMAEEWRAGRIDPLHLPVLEQSLTSLTNIQGACERIKSTPIPASYTLLIHRLVATYVFALPFGLVSATTFYTPLVVALIAYAFLGLDGIGDEIEEPFGEDDNDLPLTTLSKMIEINLRNSLGAFVSLFRRMMAQSFSRDTHTSTAPPPWLSIHHRTKL